MEVPFGDLDSLRADDTARAADAAQVGEQPLQARLKRSGKFIRLFETQAFKDEVGLCEALCDLVFGFIVGEDDDFDTCIEQSRDDVALQEIDDSHAVVGGDKDSFGQCGSFLTGG